MRCYVLFVVAVLNIEAEARKSEVALILEGHLLGYHPLKTFHLSFNCPFSLLKFCN